MVGRARLRRRGARLHPGGVCGYRGGRADGPTDLVRLRTHAFEMLVDILFFLNLIFCDFCLRVEWEMGGPQEGPSLYVSLSKNINCRMSFYITD